MSRARLLVAFVALVIVLAVVLRDGGGEEPQEYRFGAVFDTAQGIVPGQLVKIAGARVGKIDEVELTRGNKARFVMSIDERFGPFKDDASCKILPEGFISESFIQCEPGTPGRRELRAVRGVGGNEPTVPLERTSASVQLQQVIDTFDMPVSARVRAIINELGITFAGRGQDVNALLRRANPALAQTRQMLAALDAEGVELGDAVAQTDAVVDELHRRRGSLQDFVGRSSRVVDTTADRSGRLQSSVRRLPALLAQTQTSLSSLRTVADKLSPTVRALGRSAPSITRVQDLASSFSRTTQASLPKLDRGLSSLRGALRPTSELARQLQATSTAIRPTTGELGQLLESLRSTGGNEGLTDAFYGLATGLSPYDSVGHSVSIQVAVDARCIVQRDAPGCSGQFNAPGQGQIPVNDPKFAAAENRAKRILGDPARTAESLSQPDALGLKRLLDKRFTK
jgi:ABC-type transporter Mla subunit MlaD